MGCFKELEVEKLQKTFDSEEEASKLQPFLSEDLFLNQEADDLLDFVIAFKSREARDALYG